MATKNTAHARQVREEQDALCMKDLDALIKSHGFATVKRCVAKRQSEEKLRAEIEQKRAELAAMEAQLK